MMDEVAIRVIRLFEDVQHFVGQRSILLDLDDGTYMRVTLDRYPKSAIVVRPSDAPS